MINLAIDNRDREDALEDELLEELQQALSYAAKEEGLEGDYDVSLSLVTAQEIQQLNRDYRGVDAVTDVLSFPLDEEESELFEDIDLPIPLGDIVICMDRVREQAKELGHSDRREILYLSIHSFLHLLGYDHMEEDQKQEMRYREKELMKGIGVFKSEEKIETREGGGGDGSSPETEPSRDQKWQETLEKDWTLKEYFSETEGNKRIKKNLRLNESFNHAIDGVLSTAKFERNMRIDLLAAVVVLIASLFFNMSKTEFALLSISIIMVLAAETFNTAIENFCDALVGEHYHPKVKLAKDAAAGAVLLTAVNAIIVGYLIFFDKIARLSDSVYIGIRNKPSHIAFIVIALVLIAVVILKVMVYRGHGSPLRGGSVSGHAALAFCLATLATFLIHSTAIALISYALAVLVAQSRYEGKIHTVGEIILGAILGIVITAGVFLILNAFHL